MVWEAYPDFQEKQVSLNEFKLFQLTPERGFGGFAADILEKYLLDDSQVVPFLGLLWNLHGMFARHHVNSWNFLEPYGFIRKYVKNTDGTEHENG